MPKEAFRIIRDLSILYTASYAFVGAILPIIFLAKGLTIPEIGLYVAINSGTIILLQVPTGAFADAYGRKKALIIAFLLQLSLLAGLLLASNAPMLMLVAVLGGAAVSMMTGPGNAYAVDMLVERGLHEDTHRLLSSGLSWMYLAAAVCGIIGGFAGAFSLDYPIMVCMFFAFAGLVYATFILKDDSGKRGFADSERNAIATAAESFRHSIGNTSLLMTFILSVLFGIAAFGLFNYWQVVMQDIGGWGTIQMGLFMTLLNISSLLGARLSGKLKADWGIVAILYLAYASSLFLSGWSMIPLVVALSILAFSLFMGIGSPIQATIINRNTKTEIRATTESINSMCSRIGAVIFGILVFSLGSSHPQSFWLFGSATLLLGVFLILIVRPKG